MSLFHHHLTLCITHFVYAKHPHLSVSTAKTRQPPIARMSDTGAIAHLIVAIIHERNSKGRGVGGGALCYFSYSFFSYSSFFEYQSAKDTVAWTALLGNVWW